MHKKATLICKYSPINIPIIYITEAIQIGLFICFHPFYIAPDNFITKIL